ncbi:hypothetical protein BDV93DRAFT_604870 [Ceratobasidium sp. AG-I]|nr:hypothetical protein BDV93DRAFT_604870 [Ceratobasidium sp. AG-I]
MPASTVACALGGQISRIPELLNEIFVNLNRSDQARLMRVSQSFFHCVGSLLWRNAPGMLRLFSLIPGTVLRAANRDAIGVPATLKIITIKLSDSPDFTRFELYAQFIRSLDVFDIYEVRGQRALREHCDGRNGVLLPNLVSLACQYGDQQNIHAALDWVDLFLSPSLLKLFVTSAIDDYSWLVKSKKLRLKHAALLRSLPRRCPDLEEIHIPAIRNVTSLQAIGNFDMSESITLLPHLRALTGSEMLLNSQNLALLGALPHLESITIYSRDPRIATPNIDWPVDCFPALHTLQLHDLRLEMTCSMLKIKALVHKLTELEIDKSCYDPTPMDPWASHLFHDVCTQTIYITALSISFTGFLWRTFNLSSEELNLLRQLPLRSICLQGIQLGAELTHLDFILAVPAARVLRLPLQTVELRELHFYAMHLPNLEILSLRVRFDPKSHQRDKPFVPITHKFIFEITQGSELEDHVPTIASELLSLWPGVQCAAFGIISSNTDRWIAERLNDAILKYRGE